MTSNKTESFLACIKRVLLSQLQRLFLWETSGASDPKLEQLYEYPDKCSNSCSFWFRAHKAGGFIDQNRWMFFKLVSDKMKFF